MANKTPSPSRVKASKSQISDIFKPSDEDAKTSLGFWIYLMTDCILFASLFAAYAVLHNNTFGGPSGAELFSAPYVLGETIILLTSSFTCGLGVLAATARDKKQVGIWFGITFLLGVIFLGLEISEFSRLVADGNSWQRSGFLSAFFTLVGTHGLHISVGLLWMGIIIPQAFRHGLDSISLRRIGLFGMFWHFLDVIWIFIFTIVYLFGDLRI